MRSSGWLQVGSHYHLVEVNPRLEIDRALAYGRRLNIPAGTAVRFEPGETKSVPAVLIGGGRVIRGGNSLGDGVYDPARAAEVARACEARGFKHRAQPAESRAAKKARSEGGAAAGAAKMERGRYAGMFGPTTGDKVRRIVTLCLSLYYSARHTRPGPHATRATRDQGHTRSGPESHQWRGRIRVGCHMLFGA